MYNVTVRRAEPVSATVGSEFPMMKTRALSWCFMPVAIAAAFAGGETARAADAAWDATVKAAVTEGEVDVNGGPGALYAQVLTEGFKKADPQIRINFTGLSGRDAIPKILRAREAGIYGVDVYVGGTSSVLESLKPAGALAPIRPALMLPDVLDDANWLGGFDAGFLDLDKTYMYGFQGEVAPTVVANWDYVSHADLKTYQDLQKPEFAGKIVWDDPRLPGAGSAVGIRFIINFGPDFLKQLITRQKIVYISNMRQNAEWVVRGRYPIGLGTGINDLTMFQGQGLGKNVLPLDAPLAHEPLETGFGTISMLTHPPHPNAAKVYVNWLLSTAGQTAWEKTGFDSRRLDITHVAPAYFPKPGVAYVPDEAEANLKYRQQAEDIAKKSIGTQD
jgi:iron(III) transport system substrate-binding protein